MVNRFRSASRLGRGSALACSALALVAVLAIGQASQAIVVQYSSVTYSGLGDPGDNNPTANGGTTFRPDLAANGLPACQQGLTPHLNAVQPANGVADVVDINGYPGIKFSAAPYAQGAGDGFHYGYGEATGSWSNNSIMANATWMGALNAFMGPRNQHDMFPGDNGGPQLYSSTCSLFFTSNIIAGALNLNTRTHMTSGRGPFKPVTANQVPLTHDLTVGKDLGYGGTALAPRRFDVASATAYDQYVSVVAGPNKFGGGVRNTGGGNIYLGAVVGAGQTIMGSWDSGPRILGHGGFGTRATQLVTQMAIMQHNLAGSVPVTLRVWNWPYTTGMVKVHDDNRLAPVPGYQTSRVSTGFDNRGVAGTTGNIQMVSPFTGTLLTLGLYFGGTAKSVTTFAPEPGATAMLAFGVLTVLGLHVWQRRR